VPIFAYSEPRITQLLHFCSECCTGGTPTAAHPFLSTRARESNVIPAIDMPRPGIEPSLPTSLARGAWSPYYCTTTNFNLEVLAWYRKNLELKSTQSQGWHCRSSQFTEGVSKLRPAGQMRPAKPFHPAREAVLSKIKNVLRKTFWIGRIEHFPKRSHYARRPALDIFCISLCGPRTKKFGNPWSTVILPLLFVAIVLLCLNVRTVAITSCFWWKEL